MNGHHLKPRWVARREREKSRARERSVRGYSRRDIIIAFVVSIVAGYVKDFVTWSTAWLSTAPVHTTEFRATGGATAGGAARVEIILGNMVASEAPDTFRAEGIVESL